MAKHKKPQLGPCPDCNKGIKAYELKVGREIKFYPDTCDLCDGTGYWSDADLEEKFLGRWDYS